MDGGGDFPAEAPAPGPEILRFTVPPEGIDRLDAWLARMCEGFSRSRIQGLVESGRVTAAGAVAAKSNLRPPPGTVVTVSVPPPVPAVPQPEDIPIDVIYEDDELLALDKPAGIVVHPAPGHLSGTLVNALLHHCPELSGIGGVARPGIVHRLDCDTSGVMVVAKTQRAMTALANAFASHTGISKTYLAVLKGIPSPPEGRIEKRIGRSPANRKKMAVVETGKTAVTNYRVAAGGIRPEYGKALSLVRCDIETGRTHQIRVHMASIGCPVAGDPTYGGRIQPGSGLPVPPRQLLHAWRLSVLHPVTRKPLEFVSPLPGDFAPFVALPVAGF